MKNFDAAKGFFDSFYKMSSDKKIDDEFIKECFEKIKLLAELQNEDYDIFSRTIKSIYSTYQDDGIAILSDYSHNNNWYKDSKKNNEIFWERYKRHILDEGFSPNIVDVLEKKTLYDIMQYLGNPSEESDFSRYGLIIGDVQSGKTSNYIGLIAKAVDAGYRVIFLLTGTIETLRQQTQIRVEEGFIGYDIANSQDVGIGKGHIIPYSFTTREKDFVQNADNNTALLNVDSSNQPYIFVIKKNVSILKRILQAINRNIKTGHKKIYAPMLMIDDEADNASVNTKDKNTDPTATNSNIRKIIDLFNKSNYIGFTATPYANIFIDPTTDSEMLKADLFPKDFIYALSAPSNYSGAKKMFVDAENSDKHMLEIIDKNQSICEELVDIMPLIHKKEWRPSRLHLSLCEAIDRFLLVNAIRDIRDNNKNTHRSMLINLSRFTDVQNYTAELIENYVKNAINDIGL